MHFGTHIYVQNIIRPILISRLAKIYGMHLGASVKLTLFVYTFAAHFKKFIFWFFTPPASFAHCNVKKGTWQERCNFVHFTA